MHLIPPHWQFYKTHHSTLDMDWLGNWRFHWVGIMDYQLVIYVSATPTGFSAEAVFSSAAGHREHPGYGLQHRNFAITRLTSERRTSLYSR